MVNLRCLMSFSDQKTTANPNEVRICCPFCVSKAKGEDTKYHCYVNLQKGAFNCFRCGAKGGVGALKRYINLGVSYVPEKFDNLREKMNNLFQLKKLQIIDLDLLSFAISEEETPIAWHYMIDRGFSPEELEFYKVRVGKTFWDDKMQKDIRRWEGRVIFPFYENDLPIYLVGRSYIDREPRYLNTSGGKGLVIYNIDQVKDECLICEGIISSIAATRSSGIPSVAVLGKFMSEHQMMKLKTRVSKVTICLDGDVTSREKKELSLKLWAAGFDVWIANLPEDSDPDEMKEAFPACVKQAKKFRI